MPQCGRMLEHRHRHCHNYAPRYTLSAPAQASRFGLLQASNIKTTCAHYINHLSPSKEVT